VRAAVGPEYPLALVDGFSSKQEMERVIGDGTAQLISLCRPLIAEPDLANVLRTGARTTALCVRCDQCRPQKPGQALACRNKRVREARGAELAGGR
jgi:2,4-dienoyl-CoA reductase-like NADH-dependent reductase (Old Yellow Enzyme family)